MTIENFEFGFGLLRTAFPNSGHGPASEPTYFDSLEFMDDTLWMEVVDKAKRTCEFFPTIAALIKIADDLLADHKITPPSVEQAWNELEYLIRMLPERSAIRDRVNIISFEVVREMGGFNRFKEASDYELNRVMKPDYTDRYTKKRDRIVTDRKLLERPLPDLAQIGPGNG